jgi:hypothetical protein
MLTLECESILGNPTKRKGNRGHEVAAQAGLQVNVFQVQTKLISLGVKLESNDVEDFKLEYKF